MNRKIQLGLMSLLSCLSTIVSAQTTRPTHFRQIIAKSIGYDYHLQLPATYEAEPAGRFPLLIFLHGSGECGNDLAKVAGTALPRIAATQPAFPFILLAPQ